jgi:hypothetical protein
MSVDPTKIDELRKLISDEIIHAVGLKATWWTRKIFWNLFRTPAERFSRIGAAFNQWVEEHGFSHAAQSLLPRFVGKFEARGHETIPSEGPLLIASNHPGTYDALMIASQLPRNDLKIVAQRIPFLIGLPQVQRHMIFTTPDAHVRMSVFRASMRHLAEGGALLIFPSGHIDPDPSVLPGARQEVDHWSRSIEMMLQRVPQANLLVTIVSGVVARACAHSPLTRLRRAPLDRRRLAEFIQIIQQMFFERRYALSPKVTFAPPAPLAWLREQAGSSDVLDRIKHIAHQLLDEHMPDLQAQQA